LCTGYGKALSNHNSTFLVQAKAASSVTAFVHQRLKQVPITPDTDSKAQVDV
jgi:hypothetical protein